MPKKEKHKESDLYKPVKILLEKLGYCVKGEVIDCDVMATKDDTIIVVELKLIFNMKVLLQSVERLSVSDSVYIAIPNDCSVYKKERKQIEKMLRMLGIGLIVVSLGKTKKASPVLDPKPYTPKKNKKQRIKLLNEFNTLIGDPNIGGSSTKSAKMTAYRQQALFVAQYLIDNGETKASIMKDALEISKARAIVYDNHYGWFEAMGKGIYAITPKGITDFEQWKSHIL